ASIPTVTQSDTTPIIQYSKRARIAQSSVLPTVADEPASLSSTTPRDSVPRVTSPAAEEGSMQQTLNELMAFCTSLQRQHLELLAKFQAQEVEISRLKDRVKCLEDKEGVIGDKSGDDAPIKGRRSNEREAAAEKISTDSEEIARVLSSMDATTVLAGETNVPTGSGSIPTAGPPATIVSTSSEVGLTASPIVRRRKGKEILVESDTPKKKKLQEQIDAQMARELEEQQEREYLRMNEQIARDAKVARIHAEEEIQAMIDSLDKSNETVAKYLQEYQQFASDLSLEKKIELISDLVKYQDHYKKVYKFQSQQRKPMSKKQKREYYMAVIKSYLGWRFKDFKAEAIQADCDVKATNIILQALPLEIYALVSTHKVAKDLWEWIQMLMQGTSLTKQEQECKLYDEFDKFAYRKGETLRDFYLRFSLLLNDMNMYNMKLEQFQVNTKFLNTLPSEWSKFVTDVKLVRDLHTTNSYHQPQFQQQASTYHTSPYAT
nr:integrase, catalytic region, zinc finger, CCHC-type, peptidase aspartic, catalytic [Tanacetum cinerariifolium]